MRKRERSSITRPQDWKKVSRLSNSPTSKSSKLRKKSKRFLSWVTFLISCLIFHLVEKETVETDILIKKVGAEAAIADKEKSEAEIKAKETNEITANALAVKEKADAALAEAVPALEKAKAAVGGLKPENISDMTKIGNPVAAVCVTIILLMILYWEWKFKIKKIDYTDIESMRKIYK